MTKTNATILRSPTAAYLEEHFPIPAGVRQFTPEERLDHAVGVWRALNLRDDVPGHAVGLYRVWVDAFLARINEWTITSPEIAMLSSVSTCPTRRSRVLPYFRSNQAAVLKFDRGCSHEVNAMIARVRALRSS